MASKTPSSGAPRDETRDSALANLDWSDVPPDSPALPSGDEPALSSQLVPGCAINERFRLDEPIGSGGMGTVWRARDLSLEIDVAMKVLRPDVPSKHREQAAQRLLQEARAAAKLVHPGIVRITDFGTTQFGDPYIVMERLDGIDLCTALEQQPHVSAARAVRTLLPVLHALKYAHGRGVLHRDIKPENIFISRSDDGRVQPKLIDFGIARQLVSETPQESAERREDPKRITHPGAVMGSPGYMAPEQAEGRDADARADLWSVCVVLYELVTGDVPFEGKNYLALMRAIIDETPASFSDLRVGEPELWSIVERGLTKDPDQRWQTADELGVALATWLWDRGYEDDICGAPLATSWLKERPRLAPEDALAHDEPPPRSSGWHFEVHGRDREPRSQPPRIISSRPPSAVATLGSALPTPTPSPSASGATGPTSTPIGVTADEPPPSRPPPSFVDADELSPRAQTKLPLLGAAIGSAIVGVVVAVFLAQTPTPPPTPGAAATAAPPPGPVATTAPTTTTAVADAGAPAPEQAPGDDDGRDDDPVTPSASVAPTASPPPLPATATPRPRATSRPPDLIPAPPPPPPSQPTLMKPSL